MIYNRPLFVIVHSCGYAGEATLSTIDSWHRQRGFLRSTEFLRAEHLSTAPQFVAYHWLISRSGDVTRGRFEDEPTELYENEFLNRSSISIVFEGHGDFERFTEPQENQLVEILARISRQYPEFFRGGTSRLIGHREIPGVTHSCPGVKNSMNYLRQIFFERVLIARSETMPDVEIFSMDEYKSLNTTRA